MKLARIVIVILIMCCYSLIAQSQKDSVIILETGDTVEAIRSNCYSLDQYLLNYGNVMYGTVKRVKEDRFKVKVIKNIKRRKKIPRISRFSTIHFSQYRIEPNYKDSIIMENSDYIFILGNARWKFSSLVLRSPYNRFKVQNDSLFIPYQILACVNFSDSINYYKKNTFNDPLQSHGYKISITDFFRLSEALYSQFEKSKLGIIKKETEIIESNTFINSLLNHMDIIYQLYYTHNSK